MFGFLGSVIAGLMGSSASHSAANTEAQSSQQQLDFAKQVYGDQQALYAPYRESGAYGNQAYNSLLGLGPAPAGFKGYEQSPGYQWQLGQGLDAAQSSTYARGNGLSGATLQGLNQFGQGFANQDFQQYLNRLQGVAQQGQAAAGGQAGAAGNYAANGLNAIGSMGDARAAGTIGGFNALSGGLNNAIAGLGYMGGGQSGGWGGQGGWMDFAKNGLGGIY